MTPVAVRRRHLRQHLTQGCTPFAGHRQHVQFRLHLRDALRLDIQFALQIVQVVVELSQR